MLGTVVAQFRRLPPKEEIKWIKKSATSIVERVSTCSVVLLLNVT